MEFITVKDGKIESHCCGPIPEGVEGAVVVQDFYGVVGEPVEFFDKDWRRKKLSVLVAEGIVDLPEGKKLNEAGDDVIDMDAVELVESGVIEPNERQKLVDGKLENKTDDELLADGVITAAEYNANIDRKRSAAYQAETDRLFWDYQEGKAEKADWLAAKEAIRARFPKAKE
jgi:hypothetical protein